MADLMEWLKRCLDADEVLAHAVEAEVGAYCEGEPYEDGSGIASRDAYPSYPWGQSDVELEYMARWHPRSVLALVASQRAILAIHAPWAYSGGFTACSSCEDGKQGDVEWPCATVRALVSAFAGRDGYDPSWAPQ